MFYYFALEMVFPFPTGKEMVIHHPLALKKKTKTNPPPKKPSPKLSVCACTCMCYIPCWCSGNFFDLRLSRV